MSVIYEPQGRAKEYGNLAVNLYSGGCPHKCLYCFVPSALHITREGWQNQTIRPRENILGLMAKELPRLRAKVRGPEPIFMCFTCDSYPSGVDTSTTRQAIELIHKYDFGVKILTKGGRAAARDFDLLKRPSDWFGTTLVFCEQADVDRWEPGAAPVLSRLNAIEIAKARGLNTWVSLEPVIDPNQTLEIISWTHRWVDHYKVGKWNHDARANEIDWYEFGHQAEALLQKYGKDYYIKKDLAERMVKP